MKRNECLLVVFSRSWYKMSVSYVLAVRLDSHSHIEMAIIL